jgi:hypothetical protein
MAPFAALVEHPGTVPDRQSRRVHVHLVVGQLETHALVLDQRLAETLAAACVLDRGVMDPSRGTRPAHAVREPRRPQPHLGISKALADLAQHIGGRHPQAAEMHDAVAAREAAVQRIDLALDDDLRVRWMSDRNIVAVPASVLAMMIANDAPVAPVMNHLVPSMT